MGPTEQPEGRCESAERTNDRVLVKKTKQTTSGRVRGATQSLGLTPGAIFSIASSKPRNDCTNAVYLGTSLKIMKKGKYKRRDVIKSRKFAARR